MSENMMFGRRRPRSPDSSNCSLSEEDSIFNAIPASSETEDDTQDTSAEVIPPCLAANLAIFLPLGRSGSSSTTSSSRQRSILRARRRRRTVHRFQTISEEGTACTTGHHRWPSRNSSSSLSRYASANPPRLEAWSYRLRAASDNSLREPNWPRNVRSPVRPLEPPYPPPVRSPTPPGLPSFGTPEAVSYCARLTTRSSSAFQGHHQRQRHSQNRSLPKRGQGNAMRGLFSRRRTLEVPEFPRQDTRHVPIIGRADDGTYIQGRFPYRQSGHGMHLAMSLDSHPFHHVGGGTGENSTVLMEASEKEDGSSQHRRLATDDSLRVPASSSHGVYSSPSAPNYAPRGNLDVSRDRSAETGPSLPISVNHTTAASPRQDQPNTSGMVDDGAPAPVASGAAGDTSPRHFSSIDMSVAAHLQSAEAVTYTGILQTQSSEVVIHQGQKWLLSWNGCRRMAKAYCCCLSEDGEEAPIELGQLTVQRDSNEPGATPRRHVDGESGDTQALSIDGPSRNFGKRFAQSFRATYNFLFWNSMQTVPDPTLLI